MLQILHGMIGVVFLLAALSELIGGSHRRPVRFHWMAMATASVTCALNLWSSVEHSLQPPVLLWTVGVLMSYLGFLGIEARQWTLDADCACFGFASGSIRNAMYRNVTLTTVLAVVAVIRWDRTAFLLAPVAMVGFGVGLATAIAFGPTRCLMIYCEADTAGGKASRVMRLLALDSSCVKCVRLARKLAKAWLPREVDGILTDHAMRIAFQDGVPHYHPVHATTFAQLPTPCLVDIRQDGAVLNIDGTDALDRPSSHVTIE